MRTRCFLGGVLALLFMGLVAASPGWAGLDLHVGVAVTDVSLGEALLVGAVGEFFGIDTHVVAVCHRDHHLMYPEIISAFYLARLAHVDYHQVIGHRSRGHGWGRMAKDMGIHPGTFNKLRKGLDIHKVDDTGFEEAVFGWFLGEYYGVPSSRIGVMRGPDRPWLDVFVALDFAAKSGKPPEHVLTARSSNDSWKTVAASSGLGETQVKYPGKPVGGQSFRPKKSTNAASTPASDPADESISAGGPGKSNSGKGNSGSKGKGNGNGKGKSK